jgi:putative thioredoxin
MMASDYIIDVSEADFEYQVINYSQRVPVIVDFWAEWCIPCRTLGPMLEKLAEESQGVFRLAKVNVDNNQNLAMRYNVHSIPSVKAFKSGTVVAEFSGLQPEPKLRDFIRKIAPSHIDLSLEKGASLFELEQWDSANDAFQEVLDNRPDDPTALLGVAKCELLQGHPSDAIVILEDFPPSKEYSSAIALLPLTKSLLRVDNGELLIDEPLEAAFNHSLFLFLRGNIPAAMDGLLDILRQDKKFRDNEARLALLGIFELLGENNPLTRQYRQELATILF